jgi:hypothetical protein
VQRPQHLHRDDREVQEFLRDHAGISNMEASTKQNEPKCIESSQALKAAGTSSGMLCHSVLSCRLHPCCPLFFPDTYTPEELVHCSWWCLTSPTGDRGIYIGAHDRAMLLFSTSTAFRGESAHILQWSDLFVSEIPMDDIAPGFRVQVRVSLYCHCPLCPPSSSSLPF